MILSYFVLFYFNAQVVHNSLIPHQCITGHGMFIRINAQLFLREEGHKILLYGRIENDLIFIQFKMTLKEYIACSTFGIAIIVLFSLEMSVFYFMLSIIKCINLLDVRVFDPGTMPSKYLFVSTITRLMKFPKIATSSLLFLA